MLIINRVSLGIYSVNSVGVQTDGRAQINSAKTSDFFDLVVVNTKSNLGLQEIIHHGTSKNERVLEMEKEF